MKSLTILVIIAAFLGLSPLAHATVPTLVEMPRYNCNGSTTAFPFTFGAGATSEIQVILTSSAGVETILTETTNYTVTCTNNNCVSGGTVNTVTTYASGYTIQVRLNVPITQVADFTEGMPTLYETFEDGLDKQTRVNQVQQDQLNRVPMLKKTSSLSAPTLEEPQAGQILRWNLAGTGIDSTLTVTTSGNFTPSGTGAVARTVDAKLGDMISVKDFGVSGDTVGERTKAQAAITAATGKTLYVPSGLTVVLDGATSLYLPNSTSIKCDKGGGFKAHSGATMTSLLTNASGATSYDAQNSNMSIEGCTFDGNDVVAYGFRGKRVTDVAIVGNTFQNLTYSGIDIRMASTYHPTYQASGDIAASSNYQACSEEAGPGRIIGNHFYNVGHNGLPGWFPIAIIECGKGWTITGNTGILNSRAILLGPYSHDNVVTGNVFDGSGQSWDPYCSEGQPGECGQGLAASQFSYSNILVGNTIKGYQYCLNIESAFNTTAGPNNLSSCTATGLNIFSSVIPISGTDQTVDCKGISWRGGTISDTPQAVNIKGGATRTGDFTSGSQKADLSDGLEVNDIALGATSGAFGTVKTVTVTSGSFAGGDAAGTFVLKNIEGSFEAAEALDVGTDLDVATVTADPAHTTGEVSHVTVGGLAIEGGTSTNILVGYHGSDIVVEDNVIQIGTSNSTRGVRVKNQVTGNTPTIIKNMTMKGPTTGTVASYGIYANDTKVSLSGNKVYGTSNPYYFDTVTLRWDGVNRADATNKTRSLARPVYTTGTNTIRGDTVQFDIGTIDAGTADEFPVFMCDAPNGCKVADLSLVNATTLVTDDTDYTTISLMNRGNNGHLVSRAFTSGGTYVTKVGDTVTELTHSVTGVVAAIYVATGSFEDGDAAGQIYIYETTASDTWHADTLNVGANTNVMNIGGDFADVSFLSVASTATAMGTTDIEAFVPIRASAMTTPATIAGAAGNILAGQVMTGSKAEGGSGRATDKMKGIVEVLRY